MSSPRRLLGRLPLAATAGLVLIVAPLALATAASAHTADLTATATCKTVSSTGGTATAHYVVSYSDTTGSTTLGGSVTVTDTLSGDDPQTQAFASSPATLTGSFPVPASDGGQSDALTATATFSDGFVATSATTVDLPAGCGVTTPPTTTPPTTTPVTTPPTTTVTTSPPTTPTTTVVLPVPTTTTVLAPVIPPATSSTPPSQEVTTPTTAVPAAFVAAPAGTTSTLAFTGAATDLEVAAGLGLLGAGGILVRIARRRRRS